MERQSKVYILISSSEHLKYLLDNVHHPTERKYSKKFFCPFPNLEHSFFFLISFCCSVFVFH